MPSRLHFKYIKVVLCVSSYYDTAIVLDIAELVCVPLLYSCQVFDNLTKYNTS